MNRTLRAITAVIFVGIITSCAIIICQNIGRGLRVDITDQKLHTLSDGTKAILAKLSQPLKLKLYYTKTAAMKASDQIRYYNNYYYFVKALLEEYAKYSNGMINLEIIDPRPFSDEEEDALRYRLKQFPITEEENFFFGLILQTEFGVVKNIPFFTPDRHNFVEYDISHLIDTAITRQKRRIGILSSLPVMGEDVTGYMAQMMRLQNQRPRPAWKIVQHLQQKYEVSKVGTDVEEIKDVDILLVIHPKQLPEKTLFAIEQFVLKGGRAIIFVDPYCLVDSPSPAAGPQAQFSYVRSSDLNRLLQNWGVEMPGNAFAGDRSLAMLAQVSRNQRPEKIIGYLNLTRECVNPDSVITANLNQVRILFSGVLQKTTRAEDEKGNEQNKIIPLLQTTNRGNSWTVNELYELVMLNPQRLMRRFIDGSKPVTMGYLMSGRFKSIFPEGIEIPDESAEEKDKDQGDDEAAAEKPATKHLTGLTEASTDCAVIVFADVDFISDMVAYGETFFGITTAVGNNSDLLLNAIDDLSGSSELIGVRSRGNYRRPFIVVEKIKRAAEEEMAEEDAKINAAIVGFQKELQEIPSSAEEGEEGMITASILDKKKELELKIHRAQRELRLVRMKKREKIEELGSILQNLNMLSAPAVILVIAVILSIRRRLMRRRYISHASDA